MSRRAKKRIALLVTVALLGGTALAGAVAIKKVQVNRRTDAALRDGLRAHEAGEHQRAVKNLRYYVERRGDSGEAYLALAESRAEIFAENRRHLKEAMRYAQMADARLEGLAAKELLLDLYVELEYPSEAGDTADRILEVEPAHERALEVKIATLFALAQPEEAEALARRLAEGHPRSIKAHQYVLEAMRRKGAGPEDRYRYALEALQARPEDPRFLVLAAGAAFNAGELEAGSTHLADATTAEVEDPVVFRDLVNELLWLRAQPHLAPPTTRELDLAMDELLERGEDHAALQDEIALIRIKRLWKAENYPRARELALALRDDPSGAEADLLGWAAMALRSLDEDAAPLERELRTREDVAAERWAELVDADRALRDGRLVEAREQLGELTRTQAVRAWAWLLIGDLEERRNNPATALDAYQVAEEAEPGWSVLRRRRAGILLSQGRPNSAFEEARLALREAPTVANLDAFTRAAATILRQGADLPGLESIISELRQNLADSGGEPLLAGITARVLLAAGREGEAAELIDHVLQRGEPLPLGLAVELADAGQRAGVDGASGLVELAAEDGSATELLARARTLAANEGAEAGEALLRDALQRPGGEGERLEYRIALGRFLTERGDERGVELLASLAEEHPRNQRLQALVLDLPATWARSELVASAVERLRAIEGEQSLRWRIYEARRIIEHEPQRAQEVEHLLEPALEASSPDPRALLLAAQADLARDRPEEALERLQAAVEASPSEPGLRLQLASLLTRTGRIDVAQTELRTLSRYRLGPEHRDALLDQMASLGMFEEAIGVARRTLDPNRPDDLIRLARLQERAGELARATTLMEEALSRDGLAASHVEAIADYFGRRGEAERGLEVLDRLGEEVAGAERTRLRASFLQRHGDAHRAEELWRELVRSEGSPEAHAGLARFLLLSKRYAEASEAIEAGLDAHPDDPALRNLSHANRVLAGEKVPAEAIEALAQEFVQSSEQGDAAAELMEASRALDQGEIDRAEHDRRLHRLIERRPRFWPAWQTLILSLVEQGERREAAEVARRAASALPESAHAARIATELFGAVGEHEQALTMARAWRERTLSAPLEAETAIAALALDLDLIDEARTWADRYEDRVAEAPDAFPPATRVLLHVRVREGQLREAERLARSLLDRNADRWAETVVGLAASVAPDNADAAVGWLERAGELLPEGPRTRLLLAATWHDVAAATERSELHRRVLALLEGLSVEDEPTILAMRASAHQKLGELEPAVRDYRAAAQAMPSNPAILNNLAYALLLQGDPAGESVDLAERAVELAEQYDLIPAALATMLDTLGQALLADGQARRAAEVYTRALELAPFRPSLMVGRAEALLASEQPGESEAVVRQMDQALLHEELQPRDRDRLERVREGLAAAMETTGG